MPMLSRDRLPRPVDISTLYQGAARRVNLVVDVPGLRWAGLSGSGSQNVSGGGSNSSGRAVRVQRTRLGRGRIHQRPLLTGRENGTPGMMVRRNGGGRGRGTILPSWYPRTPLRDITTIVRAIETRRAELNQTTEEAPQENANAEAEAASTSQLEQQIGSQTPLPTVSIKPQPSPATQLWKITPKNVDNNEMGSDSLTPQKRLLNSIEKVREVWLEDQKKLATTPAAKRAEREKKVHTLMSMR